MLHRLWPHPDTPSSAVQSLVAEVARTDLGDFVLHYRLQGDVAALKLPKPVAYGSRADNLGTNTLL